MTQLETGSIVHAQELVLAEINHCIHQVNPEQILNAATQMLSARIFFTGAGRSGLALKMGAMRIMHLGLPVYVAGEIVTPAMQQDDLLVIASGSGTTAGALHAAQTAQKTGAKLLVFTTAPQSPLASLADLLVEVPAASKQQLNSQASQQYAGALFEQSVVIVMDILFHYLWHLRGETQEQLWKRHANLE